MSLNEPDRVFEWLYKAYDERDASLVYIAGEPLYDALRQDPRFEALLKKMGWG